MMVCIRIFQGARMGRMGGGLDLTPGPFPAGKGSDGGAGPSLPARGRYYMDGQDGSLCRGGGGQLRTEKPPVVRVSSPPMVPPLRRGDGRNMLRLYGLARTYPSRLAPSLERRGAGLRPAPQ